MNKKKWVDVLMCTAAVLLVVAMFPQLLDSWQTKTVEIVWSTLIAINVGVWMLALGFGIQRLWFTFAAEVAAGLCWLALVAMKIIFN